MTLSEELHSNQRFGTLRLFNDRGWHLEPSLLNSNQVSDLLNFLLQRHALLQSKFEAWIGEKLTDSKSYAWHQTKLAQYETENLPKDLRHYLTGEFDLETRLSTLIIKTLCSEPCRSFIRNFLGTEQYFVHYPPMVRFKSANAPTNMVPVHQDIAYNGHLKDFITVWIPLGKIDEGCGGIIVYEGSHHSDVVEHQSAGAWTSKAVADISHYVSHHPFLNAGDALLFPPTLLHESAPHTSPRVRYSLDFRVFSRASHTTKSYFDDRGNLFCKTA